MNIKEAAIKWNLTTAMVSLYLRAGRVPGAVRREETAWTIPNDSPKPEALKRGRKRKGHGNPIKQEAC